MCSEVSLILSDLEDIVESNVVLVVNFESRNRFHYSCYIWFRAPLNSFRQVLLQCQKYILFLNVWSK